MSKLFIKTFSINAWWLSVAEVSTKVLLLLVNIVLARYLGSSYYGQLSYVISISTLLAIFSDAGLGIILTREVSRRKEDLSLYLNNIISIKLTVTIVLLFILFFVGKFISVPVSEPIIFISIFIAAVMTYYNEVFRSLFRAFNQFKFETIGRNIETISLLLFVIIAVFLKKGLFFVSLGYIFSGTCGLIYYLFLIKNRGIKLQLAFDKKLWLKLLKVSVPLLFINFILILYFQISIILLGIIKSSSDVGLFSVAYNLAISFYIFPKIIVGGAFPLMSEYYVKSFDKLEKIHFFIFKYFLVLIAVVGPFISFKSKDILSILYGSRYIGASDVLSILVWMGLLLMINNLFGQTLIAMDKERLGLFTISVSTTFSMALNFLLIPMWGILGAAIAVALSEIIFEILTLFFISKTFMLISYGRLSIKPFLMATALSISMFFIKDVNFGFSGIIYAVEAFMLFFVLRIAEKSDWVLIRIVLPFRKIR